jgi:hypothetical protein
MRLDYVRVALTAAHDASAWLCIACLGAEVGRLGGGGASAGTKEAIDLLRGMAGFEHGAGKCSRYRGFGGL